MSNSVGDLATFITSQEFNAQHANILSSADTTIMSNHPLLNQKNEQINPLSNSSQTKFSHDVSQDNEEELWVNL